MITKSKRLANIEEYYFSRKLKEVKYLISKGENIISFGIGSPDIMPDEKVVKTLSNSMLKKSSFMYSSYKGIDEFRCAISDWYKRIYKVELNSDSEIAPLIGSKEGIGFISMAYLDEGDKVLVPNPSYPSYASAAKIAGAKVIYYNISESGNWYPNFEELKKIVDNKCKIIWINYPNMPTSKDASWDIFKKLVEFAKKNGLLICSDNPYSFILNKEPKSILSVDGAKDVCIELNSLSKTFNLAGARIGMLLGKEELINAPFTIQSNFSSGMFEPIQYAAMQALHLDNLWIDYLNGIYRKRRDFVYELLDALACKYSEEGVGMFVWAKVPDNYINGESFSDFLLYELKIFAPPGIVFGSNGEKFIRFSLCIEEELIKKAIIRVKENKYENKKRNERKNH